MDNWFVNFNEDLCNRYKTVINNIKNNSNSFYDSYLSLAEQFFRYVTKKDVKGSLFNIISDKENNSYLLEDLEFDLNKINKLLDYAAKINKHKHKKENIITIENVLSYMRLLYYFVFTYAQKKTILIPFFDEDDLRKCFNSNDSNKLLNEINKKLDKLVDNETEDSEEKEVSDEELKEYIKDERQKLIALGDHYYRSKYSEKDFKNRKVVLLILCLISFIYTGTFYLLSFINKIESMNYLISAVLAIFVFLNIFRLFELKNEFKVDELKLAKYHLFHVGASKGQYFIVGKKAYLTILISIDYFFVFVQIAMLAMTYTNYYLFAILPLIILLLVIRGLKNNIADSYTIETFRKGEQYLIFDKDLNKIIDYRV